MPEPTSRWRRWLKPPRRFRLTREGKWFIGTTLVLGFAAVNGGINLLFLVFGMLICLLLANGVLSEACLRRLVVTRRLPVSIHAGVPFLVGIAVRNTKKRVPTFSLEIEDLVVGKPVDRRCFYLKVPAGREQETAYRRTLPRRGLHGLSGLHISTRFPFGLLRRSIDVEAAAQLLVYPALVPANQAVMHSGLADLEEQVSSTIARHGEFESLREFRPGDDPRDIHWRTSARRGRRFVRQYQGNLGRVVMVALDDTRPPEGTPGEPAEPFEAAVSLAASVAVLLLRQGYQVGLATSSSNIAPATGSQQSARILKHLALVEPLPTGVSSTSWHGHQGTAVLRVLQGSPKPSVVAARVSQARPS
jgi:uncharacterized protein (DUF58 family)